MESGRAKLPRPLDPGSEQASAITAPLQTRQQVDVEVRRVVFHKPVRRAMRMVDGPPSVHIISGSHADKIGTHIGLRSTKRGPPFFFKDLLEYPRIQCADDVSADAKVVFENQCQLRSEQGVGRCVNVP